MPSSEILSICAFDLVLSYIFTLYVFFASSPSLLMITYRTYQGCGSSFVRIRIQYSDKFRSGCPMPQHAKKYTLKLAFQSERAWSISRRPSIVRRLEPLEQQGPTLSKERIQVVILLFSHDYSVYDTVLKMRIFLLHSCM
jgi:hypothetical protein